MDFQHEKGRIFALDADGKLLAEVTFPAENGVATITHTFVDDSLRGQGVASQILAEAAEQIRASGPVSYTHLDVYKRQLEQLDHGVFSFARSSVMTSARRFHRRMRVSISSRPMRSSTRRV